MPRFLSGIDKVKANAYIFRIVNTDVERVVRYMTTALHRGTAYLVDIHALLKISAFYIPKEEAVTLSTR